MRARWLLAAVLAALPAPALAHVADAGREAPGWTFDPWVTAPLAVSAILYGWGAARLLRRSGPGRWELKRRIGLFAAGWIILAGAVVSPLHEAGERSFTAHMVEHELLMLAAAPLLVLSRPLGPMLWALPAAGRQAVGGLARIGWLRGLWRGTSHPASATLLQAAALWVWHVPALFDLALAHEGWHIAQHLSFFGSALVFWSAMFEGRRGGAGPAVICLFATSVVTGVLGALMAFSASPWYARYAALGLAPFGLSPVEDQQLAGLLMWIPGGLVHVVAALALLGRALRDGAELREDPHAAL